MDRQGRGETYSRLVEQVEREKLVLLDRLLFGNWVEPVFPDGTVMYDPCPFNVVGSNHAPVRSFSFATAARSSARTGDTSWSSTVSRSTVTDLDRKSVPINSVLD